MSSDAMAPSTDQDTRVPVTVVTGYLGAGKTTLVNRILSEQHGLRIAVIENEFGEVGIDDALVVDAEEEIFEMNNGCICCTVRGDLIRILSNLLRRKDRFDAILVETTGLADPAPVAQTFFVDPEIKERTSLDAIVTVVDAKHLLQHLDEDKPEGVENEAVEQLAFADRVLLNKTDLVDADQLAEVERRIREINAYAQILQTVDAQVDLREILGIGAFDLQRTVALDPEFLDEDAEHQHDLRVGSVGVVVPGELDGDRLNAWLSHLLATRGVDIFRSKGILAVAGDPARVVFHGVHMLLDSSPGAPWGQNEPRESKLVFIGRDLDRDELLAGVEACRVAMATA